MASTTISRYRQPLGTAEAGQRVFGLDHGPLAPAIARREARPVLIPWGLSDEQVNDMPLITSELVTNAVTHGLPPVVLHLHAAADGYERGQVHVSDGGPSLPLKVGRRPGQLMGMAVAPRLLPPWRATLASVGDVEGLIDHWAGLAAA
ncbi:ATP-binding protein [Streptomyces sp. NPDC015127]|uniref:ATP-binding protein n=1 Tax=Streptomyces sp. NPDC015127 TaxID=3364939 RepID=UPI00370225D2